MTRTTRKSRAITAIAATTALAAFPLLAGARPALTAAARAQTPRTSAAQSPGRTAEGSPSGRYQAPVKLPHLQDGTINESSGLAASRRNPGLVWTHNDSGDKPHVYAVDRQGNTVAIYTVRGATARDWEDMAWGPGPNGSGSFLFLGDIGDNNSVRTDCVVYRIAEPKMTSGGSGQNGGGTQSGAKQNPLPSPGETVRFSFAYPDGPHNAEALLVHPRTGAIYIVTKDPSGVSGVYTFPSARPGQSKVTLKRVGTVIIRGEENRNPLVPNLVTGGDISPDGRRVILCTYVAAYEFSLPSAGAKNFDAIWKTRPVTVPLPALPQGEAICYTPDNKTLLVSSEGEPCQMFRLDTSK